MDEIKQLFLISMIIAVVNQKGGVAKTTTAIHLADWLKEKHSVILVDSDAQQSSTAWAETLSFDSQIIADADDLFDELPVLSEKYDYVIVDGPGSMSEITKAILARCDVGLVPCQPGGLDLRSSNKILRIIRQTQELRNGQPHAFLFLSRATKGTILLRESQQILISQSIPLLKTIIYQRQCIADAPGQQATVFTMKNGKTAAHDYHLLFKELFTNIKS